MKNVIMALSMLIISHSSFALDCNTAIRAPSSSDPNMSQPTQYLIDRFKYQLDQMDQHIVVKEYEGFEFELNDVAAKALELWDDNSIQALFTDYKKSFVAPLNAIQDIRPILKKLKLEGSYPPPAVFDVYLHQYQAKMKVIRKGLKPILDLATKDTQP